jgi:hypothetical protein
MERHGESAVVPGEGVDMSGVVVRGVVTPGTVPTEGRDE